MVGCTIPPIEMQAGSDLTLESGEHVGTENQYNVSSEMEKLKCTDPAKAKKLEKEMKKISRD